jgi:hypothetical protein
LLLPSECEFAEVSKLPGEEAMKKKIKGRREGSRFWGIEREVGDDIYKGAVVLKRRKS